MNTIQLGQDSRQKSDIQIVVLSGGAGTRLWPLSRELAPKQFFDFTGAGRPLIIQTLERLRAFGPAMVLTTETLRLATFGMTQRYGVPAEVIGEPTARNTAPAVALAVKKTLLRHPGDCLMGVFPADHLIAKTEAFRQCLEAGFEVALKGHVVTLGIAPTFASTGYGYMELADTADARVKSVVRFVEKPQADVAERMVRAGNYVWNAGMFLFSVHTMAAHFAEHMPELWAALAPLKTDLSNLKEIYEQLPKQSFDYGIMEKISGVQCVPADIAWSDIGSWEEVAANGKSMGRPIEIEGGNNFYTGFISTAKRATFVGVSDVIVVDTPDAMLVTRKGHGQSVRAVVETLKTQQPELVRVHTYEERPWGKFEVLMDTETCKSKRIRVWKGQKLSYQSHKKREEHWIIVAGRAEVTLNDQIQRLKTGDHIHIPLGAKHRIANVGDDVLEFIEVQTGTYFGEDDIVRYSDDYGRV